MLAYDFMVNAFLAAAIVAVVSGLVGFFLVLRGQSFAGHALAHVGFTGATGAVLVGAPLLWGLVLATVAGAAGLTLAAGLARAEAWLGIVLAFYTDWPTSFWITALSSSVYLLTLLVR